MQSYVFIGTGLDGLSYVTRLFRACINYISSICITSNCALMAVMLNKFTNYSKASNTLPVHAVVSSPLRCAVMAIMRAILKTPTRWRRLSENPILQNRYPIMVKCLNIGKNIGKSIYRSISNYDYMTAIRMLSMTGYY